MLLPLIDGVGGRVEQYAPVCCALHCRRLCRAFICHLGTQCTPPLCVLVCVCLCVRITDDRRFGLFVARQTLGLSFASTAIRAWGVNVQPAHLFAFGRINVMLCAALVTIYLSAATGPAARKHVNTRFRCCQRLAVRNGVSSQLNCV